MIKTANTKEDGMGSVGYGSTIAGEVSDELLAG